MEQRRANLLATMHRNGHATTVVVGPALVASDFANHPKSQLQCKPMEFVCAALGMQDFGRIDWQRQAFLCVFRRNHFEDVQKF